MLCKGYTKATKLQPHYMDWLLKYSDIEKVREVTDGSEPPSTTHINVGPNNGSKKSITSYYIQFIIIINTCRYY